MARRLPPYPGAGTENLILQTIVAWARLARKPPPPHLPVIVASCRLCLISGGQQILRPVPLSPSCADNTLELTGLACPQPTLKTRQAPSRLPKGATLEIFATEPGSVPEISACYETSGNRMLKQDEANGVYRFVI